MQMTAMVWLPTLVRALATGLLVVSASAVAEALGPFWGALIASLPGFYSAIREVFEASGLHGKFVAQPSRNVRHQRYFGVHAAPCELPPGFEAQVAPRLERLLDTLQQVAAATGDMDNAAGSAGSMQELVRRMFNPSPSHAGQATQGAPRPSSVQDLLDQLGADFVGLLDLVLIGHQLRVDKGADRVHQHALFFGEAEIHL